MKTKCFVTMAGVLLIFFASSQSFAGSGQLSFGDDLAEGVYFEEEVKQDSKTYAYGSRSAGDDVALIEPVFFSESSQPNDLEYLGDLSTPSLQNAMSEGICLETFAKTHLVY